MALYGDTTLAFKIHAVEYLILPVAFIQCIGHFQQPVGQGALAMVNVRNDAKIPRIFQFLNSLLFAGAKINISLGFFIVRASQASGVNR
jgi:hypothetical protein